MKYVVLIHMASYLALGLCFEIPELTFNALCLYWAGQKEDFGRKFAAVAAILRIRYVLTHFVGPVTGIASVASGIYLAYRGAISFSQGWLFWILIVASIGLYKGMYQHNLYVKELLRLSHNPSDAEVLRQKLRSRFDQALIFLELPAYVFIYWAAWSKPAVFQNPFGYWTLCLEREVSIWGVGMLILGLGSLILLPLRWSVRRYSAVSHPFH